MTDQQPLDYATSQDRTNLPRGERRSNLRRREALSASICMALAFMAGVVVGWGL